MSHAISLRHRGAAIDATLEVHGARARLVRDGRTLEAVARRDGSWIEIRSGERVARCAIAPAAHGVWVGFAGRSYLLENPRGEGGAGSGDGEEDEVRAPMTGRVVAVAAAPGAFVSDGEVLVTVEAMKMEFRLVAPRDATVESVACAPGDRVELGQVLVRLEAPGGRPAGAPAEGNDPGGGTR